ncbi:hypothetical protein, partial [Bacillus mobilis]
MAQKQLQNKKLDNQMWKRKSIFISFIFVFVFSSQIINFLNGYLITMFIIAYIASILWSYFFHASIFKKIVFT